VSWNQPEELTEQVSSEMDLDQQIQLTEEEEWRNLLMMGGIEIFLPFSQEEVENCVADAATTEAEQPVVTVGEEELEKIFETTQVEKENEHSEECLNAFIQEAEEAAALKLTAEETEGDDEHSEEWLNIFSQETEKTATWEFATEEEEEADNISLADLYEQIGALERRVKVQSMHIQQVKLEADEEGMGDHNDLPMCRKFLQLRRLHEQSQPLEQMDAVIGEIRELMIRSAGTASKEKLSREETTTTTMQKKQQQQGDGADEQLQIFIWDPGGFPQLRREAHEQELMILHMRSMMQKHLSTSDSQPRQTHAFKAEERHNPHLQF
jgi:hypothetical protein